MYKIFLLFAACHLPASSQAGSGNYTAVVAEYHSLRDTKRDSEAYAEWIRDAAKRYSADIIIFPERGLTARTDDGSVVPNPNDKIIPHKNNTYNVRDPMYIISEAAAKNKIYVVVNLYEHAKCGNTTGNCSGSARFVYNTNVAFDRKGMVVARYRKYNVYDENVNKPEKPVLSTFTTDFGVTFGMFTCFDILFKTPAIDLVREKKVRNIIFPNWWFGELPFLTAQQVQDGWSYSMNVNFLASGANEPEKGTTGSGIYLSRKSKISVMYEKPKASMIHGKIPVETADKYFMTPRTNDIDEKGTGLKLLEDPSIRESNGKDLNESCGYFREKICHNGLCCNFSLKYSRVGNSRQNYTYRAVVFQGRRRFGSNFWHDVAYCAVVLCTDGNCAKKPSDGNYPLQFDDITINADFKRKETFQMPTTLTWRDDPSGDELLNTMPYESFSFEKTDVTGTDMANVSIRLKRQGVRNLITFGIFGRKFD